MEIQLITKYIAVWGYQLIAIIFLVNSLILFSMTRTYINAVFIISLFLLFVFCEYLSLKRKREFYEYE